MLLFVLLLFTEPHALSIPIESLYKPLSVSKVAMSNAGHWYILDTQNKQVLHFDRNGKSLPAIGREGNGPGEFMLPDSIAIFSDALWVSDYHQGTQMFHLDGTFQKSRKTPKPFTLLEPVASGWVYESTDPQKGTSELFWASDDLQEEKSLLAFEVPEQEMFFQLGEGSVKVTFRPGQEIPTWHLDQRREKLYVFIPGSQDLVVVDLMTRDITGHFPLPFKREPMNVGWAKHEAKNLEKRIRLNGKKAPVEVTTAIPDTFPVISDFIVGPEGHIWLFDGPSLMASHQKAKLLTSSGQAATSDLPAADISRIIAAQGDRVWFLSFDKEKEIPIIRRCHRKELATQLARYPNQRQEEGLPPLNIRTK